MRTLSRDQAIELGFSPDPRKRRREHRTAARRLLRQGGFFNGNSAPGSLFWSVAQWHLRQARFH